MSKLVIIPTPIGNLEDITLRAIRILKECDFVLVEDTRQSGKLMKHLEIKTPLLAFHQHNEHKVLDNIIERIKSSEMVGLISDAGTPAISDPGFLLVRECITQNIEVECLPGATAFVPALVNSGFPCDKFCFEGFLPHKKGRNKRLNELKDEPRTIVFYESPYRIKKLMEELVDIFGADRKVSVSRELTKIYEETLRGTAQELLLHFTEKEPKGEFVVVVDGFSKT
jgi:16S rRNA (cytidine1402-2'-O)-methyltransferase